MFKSQKKILLYQLNIFNILFVFLFKFFFSEVFYVEVTGCIKNLKVVKILKKFKIHWVNFQDQDYDIEKTWCTVISKNIHYSDYISKILANKIWNEEVKIIYLKKDYLEACLSFKIQKECEKIFKIFEISKILSKNNTKVSLFVSKSFFTKSIIEKYYSNYLFNISLIPNFFFLKYFFVLIIFFGRSLYGTFFYLLDLNKNLNSNRINLHHKIKNKVIFFPHKGIFYLDRLKSQFYSLKKNTFLNKKNITHIEWQSNEINTKSFNFYNKNKISLIIWNSLIYKKVIVILKLKFILKKISLLYNLYYHDILFLFFHSVFQITIAQEKLLYFKNVKLALVGHDYLFPLELSLALKKANIETVCVQERLATTNISPKMIFDHYFILGPQVCEILKKKMGKTILNFYKYFLWQTELVKLKKYKYNKNKNLNCLIIDNHSETDWYSNGFILNNWSNNKNFYDNIIELAKKNSSVNFLIKSKNYSWTKNTFFSKTLKKIENMKNIKILKDTKKWAPEKCLAYSDFAIARYSSFSDQMLYINKPVLICDNNGSPSKYFPFFCKNIICKTKNDLEKKFSLLVKNIPGYNQKLNKTRKLLFYYNSIVNLNVFLEKKLQQ
jgi:hypothetical protein